MTQKNDRLSISKGWVINRLSKWASQAPEGTADLAPHHMTRLVRERLGMTQAQLAKRCGLPQSHIAKIESGTVDLQIGTLQRIFRALSCRLVLAPKPDKDLDELVREQARKVALQRVRRLTGTMAMEDQRPEEGMLEELVRAETEKLLRKRSSAIWETE
ncbi:MAG: helix-turn-helix domain-containing protein [Elusimicrobia bacterium]|nr:helix-turn-helix domain-containing protein [Elusimicrobiota bacterium]